MEAAGPRSTSLRAGSPLLSRSAGLDDEVGIDYGVARADEPDGVRHALLEDHMRLVKSRHSLQSRRKCIPRLGLVCSEEFFSHEGLAYNEIFPDGLQYVEDLRDIVGQRNVDGFDLWPKWKSSVGDDQSIGVADTAEKGVYGGIKNAGLQHATPSSVSKDFPTIS